MRATLKRYFDALIARREEGKDKGFSLIELIVVVAILGILVAVAIPVFGSIQDTAKTNSLKTAAANGATVVASQVAQQATDTAIGTALTGSSSSADYTLAVLPATGITLNNYCVTATATTTGALKGATAAKSGPACT